MTARSKSATRRFPIRRCASEDRRRHPTRKQITLHLDARVLAHCKAAGRGWRANVNRAQKKVAEL